MKLYRVTCRGIEKLLIDGISRGVSYVVAPDPTTAYEKVRKYLVKENIGFADDQEMKRIELLAESDDYSDCGTMLFL